MATPREDFAAFQARYPTRTGKERALKNMSDAQINRLIDGCSNKTAKAFYAGFKSNGIRNKGKKK